MEKSEKETDSCAKETKMRFTFRDISLRWRIEIVSLHDRLIELREQNNLSQLEVAEALNVSRQAISRWETGRAKPSTEKLIALSRLYGVALDELVGGEPARAESRAENVEAPASPRRPSPRRLLAAAVLVLALLAAIIGAYLLGRGESDGQMVDSGDMEEEVITDIEGIEWIPWGE